MQFRDLNRQYSAMKNDVDNAIKKVLEESIFIGGSEVSLLESELAEYIGVEECITCANGTEAMSLVLRAWGVGENDAVFVPDFTFFATGEVVSFSGATPIFVDIDTNTYNIDPIKLEATIQRILDDGKLKPMAIIPVDLFGLPANYNSINRIARKYDLRVLEDAAQGFGGSIDGLMAGSFGDAATTSFFPAKPLGCYGDGGAIFTDDSDLAFHLRSLKVHGKGTDKYDNIRIGVNSRLDALQAAILRVKLKEFISFELRAVNDVARKYTALLEGYVELPMIPKGYESSYAQYSIKLADRQTRDDLKVYLSENNIPSMVYYNKAMHEQGAFSEVAKYQKKDQLQCTIDVCERVLSLPMHPYMETKEVGIIVDNIKEFLLRRVV